MRLTQYFALATATTHATVLAAYFVRANPEFNTIFIVVKIGFTIGITAYIIAEKRSRLISTALLIGSYIGLIAGYYDFLRNWFIYFPQDVLNLAVAIVFVSFLAVGGYYAKFSNRNQK